MWLERNKHFTEIAVKFKLFFLCFCFYLYFSKQNRVVGIKKNLQNRFYFYFKIGKNRVGGSVNQQIKKSGLRMLPRFNYKLTATMLCLCYALVYLYLGPYYIYHVLSTLSCTASTTFPLQLPRLQQDLTTLLL